MRLPACVRSWPARHAIAIDGSDEASVSSNNAARRAGFRQAAPFAKDCPQGRGRRPIPARVDETYAAPLPVACPRHSTSRRLSSQLKELSERA